jgi:hypothetical protein
VPFVALARARGWSVGRTLGFTLLCGVGHVGSSLLLGGLALALGREAGLLRSLEEGRGALAAWGLVGFGVVYALWGLRRAGVHAHGLVLHAHGDDAARARGEATSWTLFLVFVLGPCEPLVPLVFAPASQGRWGLAAATAVVFSVATVATMVALVRVALAGVARLRLDALAPWSHALAGAAVALAGGAVLLGL